MLTRNIFSGHLQESSESLELLSGASYVLATMTLISNIFIFFNILKSFLIKPSAPWAFLCWFLPDDHIPLQTVFFLFLRKDSDSMEETCYMHPGRCLNPLVGTS
jgi:hypothetical protein